MKAFDELKAMVADLDGDVAKTDEGQHAAGTRVRKAMQAIKTKAQEIRVAVLEGEQKKGGKK